MNMYIPLKLGDEIRVIAPSNGWNKRRVASYERAQQFLEAEGFKVTFGDNIRQVERFGTGSVTARVADFNAAYKDKNVKAVMALHGGWAANALLDGINWELVRANPKPFIGFSDITVLVNALYAQTGSSNYLGPNFSSLGQVKANEYSRASLLEILTQTKPITLVKSKQWERERGKALVKTRSWQVVQAGEAEGVLIGGNLGTFYLLQGTSYQPTFDQPTILAIEDDDEAGKYTAREFDRRLESVLQLPGARKNIVGILTGRFQPESKVSLSDVCYILKRMGLADVPIIADMDFGHTWPMLTLPIGGTVAIKTNDNQAQVKLLNY